MQGIDLSNLSEPERAVYSEVLPFINEIEDRLEIGVSLLLWSSLTRRLVTRGYTLDELIQRVESDVAHQAQFNSERMDH
jgi:hypothetical protein